MDLVRVLADRLDRPVGQAAGADAERERLGQVERSPSREREDGRGVPRDRHHRDARFEPGGLVPGDAHADRVVIRPGVRPDRRISAILHERRELEELPGREAEA